MTPSEKKVTRKMFGPRKKSKISHQSGSKEYVEGSSVKNSSVENIAGSKDGKDNSKKMYDVYFIGTVPDINMGNSWTRDKEAQLVDHIEQAQIEGKLPIGVKDENKVKINISEHGIKVYNVTGQEILQRHPLHTIAQLVQYDDGGGTHNVAVKTGQVTKNIFSCYVFQCLSEEQGQAICQGVRAMFDTITVKSS